LLISILLVIIIIGIINTMFMSVKERTKEIGSLRAIGMHRRQILLMFVTEGFLLGLVATTLGSVTGALVAWIAELIQLPIPEGAMRSVLMSETLHLSVNLQQIIGGIIAMTLVTIAASLLPALRAASMQPITAIHQTG
jgi:ABC-type antimicrobial peptide transport system permease subunit